MAKYLIIENQLSLPCAVIFNEALTHKDVAGNMRVQSAGFCSIGQSNDGEYHVCTWGHSESLGVGRLVSDESYIKLAMKSY